MPKLIDEKDNAAILAAVARYTHGASREDIARVLPQKLAPRTLQFRLRNLVESGRLETEGVSRAVKYRLVAALAPDVTPTEPAERPFVVPVSRAGAAIQHYLSQPVEARKPVGYDRAFLDSYRPNARFYLSAEERARLTSIGTRHVAAEAAGTYAKQILNRLLIDLSWNSSRLEGNTYSLLDTKRLIEFGEEAAGRDRLEAQMIMNHKERSSFSSTRRTRSASIATRFSTCMEFLLITSWETRALRGVSGISPSASSARPFSLSPSRSKLRNISIRSWRRRKLLKIPMSSRSSLWCSYPISSPSTT